MQNDEKWMRRALVLAERGRGNVHPNPMVGAVLVRGGQVVAEGYHRLFGEAHAEIEALRKAGPRARGSTLYVNLEPCAHWGKTPPCVDALLQAGVKRVVAAMQDPNPQVSGKGFRALRKNRVSVTTGLLEQEARRLNRAFWVWARLKRPFVTLKAASSLDGRMATVTGEAKWITGSPAREAGHGLRGQVDAVAVGLGTVQADDPSLTTHGRGRNPIRVIFDSRLRAPIRARVFDHQAPTWSLATDHTMLKHMDQFKRKGVHVLLCRADSRRRVALADALHRLAAKGVAHLLVEGGQTLHQSFLQAGFVDEVVWFLAPVIIANKSRIRSALRLKKTALTSVGQDWCIRGEL